MSSDTSSPIGIDIRFDTDTLDIVTSKNDVATISSDENIRQAVMIRLLTPIRSLITDSNFGSRLHELIGKGKNDTNSIIAHFMVGEALIREDRITVERIEIKYITDNKIEIKVGFVPIDSDEIILVNLTLNI